MWRLPRFESRLSEADLATRARALLETCRRVAATDPAAARRALRRRGRLVQPAIAADEALRTDLLEVLHEVRKACGELAGPPPNVTVVPREEVATLADVVQRAGASDAVVVRCGDEDVVSEAEAVCALAEGRGVVLAVVGEGPGMAVRSGFLGQAMEALRRDVPVAELPTALEGFARTLGLDVRRC